MHYRVLSCDVGRGSESQLPDTVSSQPQDDKGKQPALYSVLCS
jgi:hypothetical protein